MLYFHYINSYNKISWNGMPSYDIMPFQIYHSFEIENKNKKLSLLSNQNHFASSLHCQRI